MRIAETFDEAKARYERACHAMQSGVKATMDLGLAHSHEPKHLRVGINNGLVLNGVLVRLLMEKGILTDLEYFTACADGMEIEVAAFERQLTAALGKPVTLV